MKTSDMETFISPFLEILMASLFVSCALRLPQCFSGVTFALFGKMFLPPNSVSPCLRGDIWV
jgi:hypothetical protein